METAPRPWVTYTLVSLNVVIFAAALLWQQFHGGNSWTNLSSATLLRAGASVSLHWGWSDGWRLWSSTFLHLSWTHLGLNMFCLWRLESLERILGWRRFLVLYGLSGLAGSLLSSAVPQPFLLSAGASGAIFGLFGAMLVVSRGGLRRSLVITILANAAFGLSISGINNWAHFGGFAAGALSILWLRSRPRSPLYGPMFALFALLSLWSALGVARPKPWEAYAQRSFSLGSVKIELPIFFRETRKDGVTYLQSPQATIACTPGYLSEFSTTPPPREPRIPSPLGFWWLLPQDAKHPQAISAILPMGYEYWRMDVWSEQQRSSLQMAVNGLSLDARQSRQLAMARQLHPVAGAPGDWNDCMLSALAQLRAEHPKAAEASARQALAQAPDSPQAQEANLVLLILSLGAQEHWKDALEPARRLIQVNPKSAQSYNWLAWSLVQTKDYLQAKKLAEQALQIEPENANLLDTYAAALIPLGEAKKGLQVMQKAQKLTGPDPHLQALVQKRLGEAWLALGDREKARAAWQQALQGPLEPKDREEVDSRLKS